MRAARALGPRGAQLTFDDEPFGVQDIAIWRTRMRRSNP
jgi:hypothetical protein